MVNCLREIRICRANGCGSPSWRFRGRWRASCAGRDNAFYEGNLLHVAAHAISVDAAAGANGWSCGLILEIRGTFDVEAPLANPEFVPDRTGLAPLLEANCPA